MSFPSITLSGIVTFLCKAEFCKGLKQAQQAQHTWDDGSKVGSLAGVTPSVDVGSSHGRGGQPAFTPACTPAGTPAGASGVAWKDGAATCNQEESHKPILVLLPPSTSSHIHATSVQKPMDVLLVAKIWYPHTATLAVLSILNLCRWWQGTKPPMPL